MLLKDLIEKTDCKSTVAWIWDRW